MKQAIHFVVLNWLAPIARHPFATVLTGVGLVLSGVMELAADIFTGFETAVSAYHGLILLGLVTGLRGLADVVEGIEWLSKEAEAERQREAHEGPLTNAAKLPPDIV